MSLLTLSNPSVSNVWNVVLDKHSEVENDLPLTFFNIKNGSSLTLIVYLNGSRAGIVEAYSMDTYIGKQFETFTVTTKDGDNLAIDDVFVQVGNNIQMTTSPYNPSWEMLEENIDVFASGCNDRLSLSDVNTTNVIKYWINVQNALTVQRRLSIQGSASLGSYAITFDDKTIINGGVPINGEVLDTKQYKKVIQNGEFDYTVTNATIKGWMIDYNNHVNDNSDNYTEVVCTGGPDISLSYDNDLITHTDTGFLPSTGTYTTFWEVSFPSISTKSLHSKFYLYNYGDTVGTIKVEQKVNGLWVIMWEQSQGNITYYKHYDTSHDLVTGIRYQYKCTGSGNNFKAYVHDITIDV